MPDWNGKTIGNVQIGGFIARGGMAEVYLGEHTQLKRKVAVKIMRDHVDYDPNSRLRFEREARVVASLRHPNIIQMLDYGLIEGQPCLVMEYVPGATLGNYQKALQQQGKKLPIEMVVKIVSALASAVDHAHARSIIHRDIKPANVLLRSASGPVDADQLLPADVEPILTDFGLVRLIDSSFQTSTGNVTGTPAYMSPEQARGDKVDSKTDIYSLGVMLYEMIAGEVPFEAESSFGVLMKHLNDPPPPIHGISSDLQDIINRALAKDPELRYASAGELADELASVTNGNVLSPKTLEVASALRAALPKAKEPRFIWRWAMIGTALALGLVFAAYRLWPVSGLDENRAIGRIVYSDQNGLMDKASIILTGLPAPKTGSHYDVWVLAEGGENRLNIGSFAHGKAQAQLVYTNPNQENILSLFDQFEVTLEADNDPQPDESSGEIVASSVFPPLALIHVRHVLVSFPPAPEETALIQGLWDTSDWLWSNVDDLIIAFENNDEPLVRQKTEEIINLIAGSADANRYKDWNNDGVVSNPTDGFGLLPNGEPGYNEQGYIQQTISHAQFAAQAVDATENIKTQSANVISCLDNMNGWAAQLLEKALLLQSMPLNSDMAPLIAEMKTLSDQIISGVDSNGNQLIEPIPGEGGATTAYEYAYYMAEMPLLLGAQRIPEPAPTQNK